MSYGKLLGLVIGLTLVILFVVECSGGNATPAVAEAPAATSTPVPPTAATPVPATATPTPPKNSMGVWGSSGSDVFAVGCQGIAASGNCILPPGMILHYDGRAWSPMTTPATDWLSTVWGTSGSDVFAAGNGGTLLHYDGKAWSSMDSGTDQTLYGVWGSSGRDVFAVGNGGTILHYDGSAWSPMKSGIHTTLNTVWGNSGSDVFATGDIGAILYYDGSAWSPMKSGTYSPVLGVWGSSGRDVFAVGEGGAILHYDGSAWSPMESGTAYYNNLESVWGSSGSDVFAVGSGGTILHYDGKAWSPMSSGTALGFESVWGSSGSDVFAVGEGDTILHYNGKAWSDMSSGTLAATLTETATPQGKEGDPQLVRGSYISQVDNLERDYFLYLPKGYGQDPNQKWPVMIFLHGDGERGDGKADLDYVLTNGPLYEAWIQKRDLPFILVVPQLHMFDLENSPDFLYRTRDGIPQRLAEGVPPHSSDEPARSLVGPMVGAMAAKSAVIDKYVTDHGWHKTDPDVITILDAVLAKYNADANRVYLTGLSMGGYGTWYYASKYPEKFAAILPLVGFSTIEQAEAVAKAGIPAWIFSGGRDPYVETQYFFPGMNKFEAMGGEMRFTTEQDMFHDVWNRVYAGEDVYNWLLQHQKQ